MHEVKRLNADHATDLVTLGQQAYTANATESKEKLDEIIEKTKKNLAREERKYYGVMQADKLIGSMQLFDYEMNVFGQFMKTGGLSSVAVDLLHKKKRIAKSMVEYYLKHYDEAGYTFGVLYAFRPDFYHQMGFGYGTKMDQYRIAPHAFPNFGYKGDLVYLQEKDLDLLVDCYNRFAAQHHGAMKKVAEQYEWMIQKPNFKYIGIEKNGHLTGYVVFSFMKREDANNTLSNNIMVHEFVYTDDDALRQLCTFLHSQKDQVHRLFFQTQDEAFHHLLTDPRDGSDHKIPFVYHQTNVSGVGLMYRVINVKRLFMNLGDHRFGQSNLTVTFDIQDSFYQANEQEVTVKFNAGKPTVIQGAKPDVNVTIDIADFSSLIMGVVDFDRLHLYGKISLDDSSYVEKLTDLFHTKEKPICLTNF